MLTLAVSREDWQELRVNLSVIYIIIHKKSRFAAEHKEYIYIMKKNTGIILNKYVDRKYK